MFNTKIEQSNAQHQMKSRKFPPKRLLRDFKKLQEEGPEEGIFVKCVVDGDLSELRMMIVGPKGPYYMCLFFFHIKFPQPYPLSPPEVKFHCPYSIRCHPNSFLKLKLLFFNY